MENYYGDEEESCEEEGDEKEVSLRSSGGSRSEDLRVTDQRSPLFTDCARESGHSHFWLPHFRAPPRAVAKDLKTKGFRNDGRR